jgi:hypothetical protein
VLRLESIAFIPQLLLSAVAIPLVLAKKDLASTLLAQTFAFVTFNKVCTSQVSCTQTVFVIDTEISLVLPVVRDFSAILRFEIVFRRSTVDGDLCRAVMDSRTGRHPQDTTMSGLPLIKPRRGGSDKATA